MEVFANAFTENKALPPRIFSLYLVFSRFISLYSLECDFIFILEIGYFFQRIRRNNKWKNNGTIEIRIQGGIKGANGIQTNFKVYPVQMVTRIGRPKSENGGSGRHNSQPARTPAFGSVLEKKAAETVPEECYTVTYDRRSRLQTYYYRQSREYTWWQSVSFHGRYILHLDTDVGLTEGTTPFHPFSPCLLPSGGASLIDHPVPKPWLTETNCCRKYLAVQKILKNISNT